MSEPNTNQKGDRNETEAKNILSRVWRKPEKVDGYGNTDPWNIADIIAMDPSITPGILIAQVKTNGFSETDKKKIHSRARHYIPSDVRIECWNRVEREGWRVHVLDWTTGEFTEIVHMDTCDIEETVTAYRTAVDFYPKETLPPSDRHPPER